VCACYSLRGYLQTCARSNFSQFFSFNHTLVTAFARDFESLFTVQVHEVQVSSTHRIRTQRKPLTACFLTQLPFLLVTSFIFSIIVYGMADISLNSATNFVTSLAAIFLYTLAMVYFGLLVAEVALNAKVSAACFDPSLQSRLNTIIEGAGGHGVLCLQLCMDLEPFYNCGQTQEGKAEGRIVPLIWQSRSPKFWRLYCPAWVSAILQHNCLRAYYLYVDGAFLVHPKAYKDNACTYVSIPSMSDNGKDVRASAFLMEIICCFGRTCMLSSVTPTPSAFSPPINQSTINQNQKSADCGASLYRLYHPSSL
jgi:hypothetical protein